MDEIVVAKWPALSVDLEASTIVFLGKQMCRSAGLRPRHNLEARKMFSKLLTKFHPDKVKNLFGNLELHQFNFRAWYVANLIGKFCIQMLKLSKGENATSNEIYPLPLCTSNLNLNSPDHQPIRITCLDAMAITAYQDRLRTASTEHVFINRRDAIITKLSVFTNLLSKYNNWTNLRYRRGNDPIFKAEKRGVLSNIPHIDVTPKQIMGRFDTRTPNHPIFVRVINVESDDEGANGGGGRRTRQNTRANAPPPNNGQQPRHRTGT